MNASGMMFAKVKSKPKMDVFLNSNAAAGSASHHCIAALPLVAMCNPPTPPGGATGTIVPLLVSVEILEEILEEEQEEEDAVQLEHYGSITPPTDPNQNHDRANALMTCSGPSWTLQA